MHNQAEEALTGAGNVRTDGGRWGGPHPMRMRGWLRTAVLGAVTSSLATGASLALIAPEAHAAGQQALVNSLGKAGDTNPSDGVCDTGATVVVGGASQPECTIRAAVETTNALSTAADRWTISPAPAFAGGVIDWQAGDETFQMVATGPAPDYGYYYDVTAPVVLDFQSRLGTRSTIDLWISAFHINAPNVEIRDFDLVSAGETAFTVDSAADGTLFQGGSCVNDQTGTVLAAIGLERCIDFIGDAKNTTIRDVTFGNTWNGDGGVINLMDGVTVDGLTIERSRFISTGSRLDTNPTYIRQYTGTSTLLNAKIVGSSFSRANTGFTVERDIDLSGITATNLTIADNTFSNVRSGFQVITPITINQRATNAVIRDNRFSKTNDGPQPAIQVNNLGITDGRTPNGWTIADNSFTGYAKGTVGNTSTVIYLSDGTGATRVVRNRFAASNAADNISATAPAPFSTSKVLLSNAAGGANQQLDTWVPTSATYDAATNSFVVKLTYPTRFSSPKPAAGSTVGVFYTNASYAEVYLGSARVSARSGTVTIRVPATATTRSGKLRVQTLDADGFRSSQYSGTIPAPANKSRPVIRTLVSRHQVRPGARLRDIVWVTGLRKGVRATVTWQLVGPVKANRYGTCRGLNWRGARVHDKGSFVVKGSGRYLTRNTRPVKKVGCYTYTETIPETAITYGALHKAGHVSQTTLVKAKRKLAVPTGSLGWLRTQL